MTMREKAENYLRTALGNPGASFRDGQWESIEPLLNGKRLLVVQRTGWGKSMVYFLATKLLREEGAGPTLLISPLLSLMRNQIEAAERIGVRAITINSTNPEEWEELYGEARAGRVDLILVSPERLANDKFRANVLAPPLGEKIGLFAVDEAHCISDWGHDFRPDYRRIVRILQVMPPNIPILATTATANNRVVQDIREQLGNGLIVQRGPLVRKSLTLQNIDMPSPAARLAWLAQTLPSLPGSGIVYTLTVRDCKRVAEWLRLCGISAEPYYAKERGEDYGMPPREELERRLMENEIKVLVATVALGMGFDKPDIGFVIHYQRPASVVSYYQQVGRAGRAVDQAYGVLLCGEEDDSISDFFIKNAFPPQKYIYGILGALIDADEGLSMKEMGRTLNIPYGKIQSAIHYMACESPSPIVKIKTKWFATAAAMEYQINREHVEQITRIRCLEQEQMHAYMAHTGCLMSFLQEALDDPCPMPCGKCANCRPDTRLDERFDSDLAARAVRFLKRCYQPILPRKQWPAKDLFTESDLGGFNISPDLQFQPGRALSLWRDAGWGTLVARGKYQDNRFSDQLVQACVEMLKAWKPDPRPEWVTCVPSLNRPGLVPDFARRVAQALGLPFIPCVRKVKANPQQKMMENSYQQVHNLDGVFEVEESCREGACLLVDDIVDSRWTFTVIAALLRAKGCGTVFPLALALNTPRQD